MNTPPKTRVRFAPSPTGGLHLGGVRTVLYNFLFARQHQGVFVLRIEDTDQNRYVYGAEAYILQCLKWCGLQPDESPVKGGKFAPYRQSERKALYHQYAQQLIDSGHAYYAFDTPEELEQMRGKFRTEHNTNPQYDSRTRMQMRNSITLSKEETEALLLQNTPRVIRIKMPEAETVTFTDMIRGEVSFDTSLIDDKVLLKADGMPTYHLAVVVDDYLMEITHAFRGEEWLPSAPVHLLLWKYLGWQAQMPQWAHLPLILKPDGNGKLSKRDGDRLGFPVFAMDWNDPKTGNVTEGFKEKGFLPEAFINMLAALGWNDGTEQEIFTKEELIERFSIERVHKAGARFDYDKAKWYNHQFILRKSNEELAELVAPFMAKQGVTAAPDFLTQVVGLVKERCHLLTDFWQQGHFFFTAPKDIAIAPVQEKWNAAKAQFFEAWMQSLPAINTWQAAEIETHFMNAMQAAGLKKGDVLLPLRIMLVGDKYGPGVFDIAALIGMEETASRIGYTLTQLVG